MSRQARRPVSASARPRARTAVELWQLAPVRSGSSIGRRRLRRSRSSTTPTSPTRAGELDRLQGMWSELLPELDEAADAARHRFYVCYEQGGQHRRLRRLPGGRDRPADQHRRARLRRGVVLVVRRGLRGRCGVTCSASTSPRSCGPAADRSTSRCGTCSRTSASCGPRAWEIARGFASWTSQRALASRRYEEAGELVIEVEDSFCPWNDGRFRLTVDGDGMPTTERVDAAPDLVVPAAAARGALSRRCPVPRHGRGRSDTRALRRRGIPRRPDVPTARGRRSARRTSERPELPVDRAAAAAPAGVGVRAGGTASDPLQLDDLGVGRHLADELDEVRVAGEEENLVAIGGVGERLGDRRRPSRVEVHEHVVEDEGEGFGAFGEGLGQPETQAEVELLDGFPGSSCWRRSRLRTTTRP